MRTRMRTYWVNLFCNYSTCRCAAVSVSTVHVMYWINREIPFDEGFLLYEYWCLHKLNYNNLKNLNSLASAYLRNSIRTLLNIIKQTKLALLNNHHRCINRWQNGVRRELVKNQEIESNRRRRAKRSFERKMRKEKEIEKRSSKSWECVKLARLNGLRNYNAIQS